MGYFLDAIVGPEAALRAHAKPFKKSRIVRLGNGLALIPMTEELHLEMSGGKPMGAYNQVVECLSKWVQTASKGQFVAYVQAGFFGGQGTQSAIVWKDGKGTLGPMTSFDAINQALKQMGVVAQPGKDEFDTVGLGRHRDTEDWIKDA